MNNQMMAKVIITMSALLVLALGGCGQVNDSVLTANGPAFPPGLTASPGNGQVVLTWSPIKEATSYNVYWSTVPGVDKATGTKISNITSTLYTHTTVTNGVIYYYVVTAVDKNKKESDNSEEVSAMPAATLGIWSAVTPSMPTARDSMTSSVINGEIYVINGERANGVVALVEKYNPISNTWTTMPTSTINAPRDLQGGSAFNNQDIYLIGGLNANNTYTSTVLKYTPGSNTWTTVALMPTPRFGLTSCATNTNIYAIGGSGGSTSNTVLGTLEAYNPAGNSWSTMAPMLTPRLHSTCSISGNVIYVFGGEDSNGSILATVEAYNIGSNTWSYKKFMPTAREMMTSSVINGKIYVIGGWNGNFNLHTVEVYDPASDSWTSVEAMPTARDSLTSAVVGSQIYAIGGWDGFKVVNTVEKFTP